MKSFIKSDTSKNIEISSNEIDVDEAIIIEDIVDNENIQEPVYQNTSSFLEKVAGISNQVFEKTEEFDVKKTVKQNDGFINEKYLENYINQIVIEKFQKLEVLLLSKLQEKDE